MIFFWVEDFFWGGGKFFRNFLIQFFCFYVKLKLRRKKNFEIFLGRGDFFWGGKSFWNFLSQFFLFLGEIEIEKK